jgi:hypothetical protein
LVYQDGLSEYRRKVRQPDKRAVRGKYLIQRPAHQVQSMHDLRAIKQASRCNLVDMDRVPVPAKLGKGNLVVMGERRTEHQKTFSG